MSKCQICFNEIKTKPDFSSLFKPRQTICNACKAALERVNCGCKRCGKKTNEIICSECLKWESNDKFTLVNHSLFYYNKLAKDIIKQIKFSGDIRLLYAFKKAVINYFKLHYRSKKLILIPVPLHEDRLRERGFNQSLIIARLLPFKVLNIFEKVNNERQSKKTKIERMNNRNSFKLTAEDLKKDYLYIIIDDIYTTGATVHSIARMLHNKGITNIESFTLFRS